MTDRDEALRLVHLARLRCKAKSGDTWAVSLSHEQLEELIRLARAQPQGEPVPGIVMRAAERLATPLDLSRVEPGMRTTNQADIDCAQLILAYLKASPPAQAIPEGWVSVESKLPGPRMHVLCLNRDGFIFEGCICYGLHKPFFTYPHGDGSPSNTAPGWIDVTHWMPKPAAPKPEETISQKMERAGFKRIEKGMEDE